MTVLPSGLVVPPLAQLAALVVAAVAVAAALWTVGPTVDRRLVVAAVPWMVLGAAAHALYQIAPETVFPGPLAPFVTAPAVYVATAVLAGGCWAALEAVETPLDTPTGLGVLGAVAVLVLTVVAGLRGGLTEVQPFWSLAGVVLSVVVTAGVYLLVRAVDDAVESIRTVAVLAVFAHALDGVTTTIGVDVIGTGERSPLPAAIMEFAGTLPTEPFLGTGWLFVLVKLAIAVGIVLAFADIFEDAPRQGTLLFLAVVAFGLGPAVNNLVLFALREQSTLLAATP
jgi:uncharacterized membrane protein